ncbi:zf-UBP domain-containing protein/BRAP2 domain-containing protein [Cephalotus follicularis]|uniref:Zf-UBP domain-containing protein/BRAP2 domain-containing protein n=1 Tax=Cephalotus follicularis TaxID=3775 RepID=A0A1Q3CQH6_CEPFO|nr:zf-UBP domain-containing protein/BRAP2 domain-containing protein [Cephalotus follicularis]
MFILRVHSVDTNHPLSTEEYNFTAANSSNPNHNTTKFIERRGIVHLYRNASQSSLPNPASQSTSLFVVAVPNYLSADDFIRFCGPRLDHVDQLLFIRDDGMDDRYSVLIKLVDQSKADEFHSYFNGKRFMPAEAEVCHMLYTISIEFTESVEVASTPPDGFTELPSCPICLERLDPDTSGILSTLCDHSFQCSCTSKWTYLSCQVCRFCQKLDEKPTCSVCGTVEYLWVCLICGIVRCGRYKEGHAIRHWKDTQHCYSLDLTTQQIWDYVGDNYVHRLNQSKVDGKPVEMISRCISLEGNCGTCECSEDSGISGALFSSKVETIVDEYNRLLATQLENQRQYYESLISEAKVKRESLISEAVEKALNSRMHEIQNELENCEKEKNAVADINQNLIKNQDIWRNKVKEIEERLDLSLKMKDEKLVDLEEQMRDLTVYIEAQTTLSKMSSTDDIKGGTVLPVPEQESSPANTRRHKKSGRRRN